MKKLLIIISVILFYSCSSHITPSPFASLEDSIAFDSRPYVNGEILLPDMVHDDTLIVFNAEQLNLAFDGVDKAITPGTDLQINSVLHAYCIVANSLPSDYGLSVDQKSYTIYDKGRKVATFNYGLNPVLDSVIDNDNQ